MNDSMREQIIQVLLSTRSMSEGDTADALLSVLAAQPPAQAEPNAMERAATEIEGGEEWITKSAASAIIRRHMARPEPSPDTDLARAIHWPDCWDTAAYPTAESALVEVYEDFRCSTCGDTEQQRRDAAHPTLQTMIADMNGEIEG